jgi:LCP family protein required for cell wall assembly
MPSSSSPPIARHGRLPRSRPWATVLSFVAATLAVVLVSAGAVAGFAVYDVAKSVKPGVKLIGETKGPPPDIGSFETGFNVLVAASDSGGGDVRTYGKRGEHLNDVTMLLHVSADHTNATVVSFPRDLIVPIASCPNPKGGNFPAQTNKINVALTYGGLACIVKTVEDLTGLSIPFAALTEFQGVVGLSNAVGGVTVCIAKAIHDEQISFDLEAGQQTLVGQRAVQFLRVRYGVDGGTDIARISNQQLFLSALVRKIKTPETLGNPIKVYELATAVAQNMTLTNSLKNPTTLPSMAVALKNISFDDIVFVQYPGSYGSAAGQNGVLPARSSADVLFTALQKDQRVSLTGKTGEGTTTDPTVTVAPAPNGSAAPGGTASPAPAVQLPSNATGQTAAQSTCTKGQRAKG